MAVAVGKLFLVAWYKGLSGHLAGQGGAMRGKGDATLFPGAFSRQAPQRKRVASPFNLMCLGAGLQSCSRRVIIYKTTCVRKASINGQQPGKVFLAHKHSGSVQNVWPE
jgi:hypothetical protein